MFRIFTIILAFFIGYLVGAGAIAINKDIAGPAITNAIDYVASVSKDVYTNLSDTNNQQGK